MPAPPIFPKLITEGWSRHKRPTWTTIENESKSGRSLRAVQQRLPQWEFELTYEELRSQTQNQIPYAPMAGFTELEQVAGIYNYVGTSGAFFYEDLEDNSRRGQEVAIGDGVNTTFTFVRTWGTGLLAFTEPVGGLNLVQAVYKDGVLVDPSHYTFINDNQIVFDSPPGNGVVVTSDFYFVYRCRFTTTTLLMEEFLKNRWSIRSVKFRSIIGR